MAILKKLQDLCSSSGELPSSFVLENVVFDRKDVVGKGGEALVYRGDFNGRKVVVREVVMSERDWRSAHGQKIIKVTTKTKTGLFTVTHSVFLAYSARGGHAFATEPPKHHPVPRRLLREYRFIPNDSPTFHGDGISG